MTDWHMEGLRVTKEVLNEVAEEREKQDAKWGQQDHPQVAWIAIAGEEFGEVSKEVIEAWASKQTLSAYVDTPFNARSIAALLEKISKHEKNSRAEWIQLAAVCVAAVESLDRNELTTPAKPTAPEDVKRF